MVQIPRMRHGSKQTIETLINEEAYLFAKFLRCERETWVPRIVSLQGNMATISTNLGTLTGTVTSINSTVATIQTSLGTLEVTDQGVKSSSDTTGNYSLAASALSIISIIILLAVAIQVFRKHK
ncbi:MAG: hypothetical protein ABSD73_07395 [Candidatus Bathyarchaeia archaeon]|jgi:hypothetical protein